MRKIFAIETEIDFERSFPVMRELRPHLSFTEFKEIYNQARNANGYQIIVVEQGGQIVALMGYRYLSDFVRGRHLYIDDLVVTEHSRSQKIGAELLRKAEEIARKENCRTLRLCTGFENVRGIKFYNQNGWMKKAFAYTKALI